MSWSVRGREDGALHWPFLKASQEIYFPKPGKQLQECLGAYADVSICYVKWEVGEKAKQNVTRMSGFIFW